MKQIDLWGNDHDVEEYENKIEAQKNKKKHLTIKEKFRQRFGYLENHYCKKCFHLHKMTYHGKTYYKCPKIGISNSAATDIRLKEVACTLFKENYEVINA